MQNIRNYEEIVKQLKENKQDYENSLELLNKVEYKRKKDGTLFANINKNFENGRVEIKSYNDSNHPSFVVSGYVSSGNYAKYDFDAYMYVDDMRKANPEDERIKNIENTDGFWRNTYLLTVSEIEEKIEQEKVKLKSYIENYERQIEESGKIFDIIANKFEELKTVLYEECKPLRKGDIYPSTLEYALQYYIKNNL